MHGVVYAGRAVLRGRGAGMHEESAYILWADDSGRVGDADVQACGSSSAAVWGLAARGTGFGDFADARVAGDYQPAEGKSSFFEAIVRVGKVEPTCEARLSPLGKKLNRTQCRENRSFKMP